MSEFEGKVSGEELHSGSCPQESCPSSTLVDALPEAVLELFSEEARSSRLAHLFQFLLKSYRAIGAAIRDGDYSHAHAGTQNTFGDHQLDVDLQAEEEIMRQLRASGLVHTAASEENPVETSCGGDGFSVVFDPLDGSSIVDCNFAVGTITGIFPGSGLLGRTGRELVAAAMAQYGPRVTVIIGFSAGSLSSGQARAVELTMVPTGWELTREKLVISPRGKTFAPGNLRATADNPNYASLVTYWVSNQYTLRYSGGLVPDVYHILIKGQGVLSNASSPTAKAKLRLLFEAAPIALIVEAAEGSSCVCPCEANLPIEPTSLLDVVVSDLDKRVGLCYGSKLEVERFRSYIFG